MNNCENDQQMEKYYKIAQNFDKSFTGDGLIPNCLRYDYVAHDYFSDYYYEKLDSKNESELTVLFSTFHKKVIWSSHIDRFKWLLTKH